MLLFDDEPKDDFPNIPLNQSVTIFIIEVDSLLVAGEIKLLLELIGEKTVELTGEKGLLNIVGGGV